MTTQGILSKLRDQLDSGNTVLYLTHTEWHELYQTSPDDIKKRYTEHGYPKAVDPMYGKERPCLLYRALPVFRNP